MRLEAAAVSRPGPQPDHPVTVLEPLDLVLSERRISVIGANGSGKSTLLRLLNGLVLPTRGRVLIDGLDTREHAREVRQRVAFAFTDPLAQLVMPTGREDVELSLRRRHRDKHARRAAAEHTLEALGLLSHADTAVSDLSGGERQLMALASVLATEPDILVLDEPSTLLDLRNAMALSSLLAGLPQTVVVATHDLPLAARAERTLVIEAGTVAFDGPPPEAISFYTRLATEPASP